MSIFALSDLHLPLGIDKPMEVFGAAWENYVPRIKKNWEEIVREEDTVLICGDFSWATYLEQSLKDFEFLHALPGRKILSKGNHDYWWSTAAKLEKFKDEHGFEDITFLHNNSVCVQEHSVCAARGWKSPFDRDFTAEDEKIYERELIRLRLSLEAGAGKKIIAMLHYPPGVGFNELLDEFGVEICIYGHLHGKAAWADRPQNGRDMLVSADFLEFVPVRLV